MTGLTGERYDVMKMYDVGCKLLNSINSLYVNSLVCIRVNGDESGVFDIDSGARQGRCESEEGLKIMTGRFMEVAKKMPEDEYK